MKIKGYIQTKFGIEEAEEAYSTQFDDFIITKEHDCCKYAITHKASGLKADINTYIYTVAGAKSNLKRNIEKYRKYANGISDDRKVMDKVQIEKYIQNMNEFLKESTP